jgi:hypothetical protein
MQDEGLNQRRQVHGYFPKIQNLLKIRKILTQVNASRFSLSDTGSSEIFSGRWLSGNRFATAGKAAGLSSSI